MTGQSNWVEQFCKIYFRQSFVKNRKKPK